MTAKDEAARGRACGIEIIQDLSAFSSPLEGYLRRHRKSAKILLDDGSRTAVHIFDYVDRRPGHDDAVAVALHTPRQPGMRADEVRLLLRRQFRYPVHLVEGTPLFLEVVAGIVEAPESPEGAAVREIAEEAGIAIEGARVRRLGSPFFSSPGAFAERIFPIAVEVSEEEIANAHTRTGDGSPMEEGAELVVLGLADTIDLLNSSTDSDPSCLALRDAKTEIVLRRLCDALARGEP